MDVDDLDALLALLAEGGDAAGHSEDQEVYWSDEEGKAIHLSPLLALEHGASGVLALQQAKRESDESARSTTSEPLTLRSTTPSREHTRLTKKEELELLREQVESLTARLKTLKVAAGIGSDTPVARLKDRQTVVSCEAGRGLGLWEKLAARQLARRQAAEEENRALRASLKTQSRRAKRLRLMMTKRAARAHHELGAMLQRTQLETPLSRQDDAQVLDGLARSVDKAYASVDVMFTQAKMQDVSRPGRLSSGRDLGPGRWSIEVRDVHMLPFDWQEVALAVWRVISDGAIHHETEARKSFQFTFQLPFSVDITMLERSVARRYREPERVVIVFRAVLQPMECVLVHDTRCIVIRRGEEAVSGPTAVIETYVSGYGAGPVETLAWVDSEISRLRQTRPSVEADNFGLKEWAASVTRMHVKVEDVLMEPVNGPLVSQLP